MKPDLDLQLAYFVAVEKCQSKLIENMLGNNDGTDDSLVEKSVEVASTDGDIESLFKAAHNCSRYLEDMTSAKNRQDIANLDAFTAMLRFSIKAWSRASHSTLLLPDGSTPLNSTQGVEEMAKVLKRISLRNHGQDSADHCVHMSFTREDLLRMTSFCLKATIYDTISTEKPCVGVLA